ncbi:MAG: S8 family serine peptidase [Acidimicrobiia bacterium]
MAETDEVAVARRRLRRRLGAALAAKASAPFCLALERAGPDAVRGAGAGAGAGYAILECRPSSGAAGLRAAPDAGAWAQVRESLSALGPGRSQLGLAAGQVVRHSAVRAGREEFLRAVGPVVDALDRAGAASGPEGGLRAAPPAGTQPCWLNRTIRSPAHPAALAEVAGDEAVERIDVPRPLEPEVTTSTAVVGAPALRAARGLTGRGVLVAVIDGEVALRHPAFSDRVVHRANFTAEPWGDPSAHATAVAGIVAGGGGGVEGVAPEAVVYNYKVIATGRFTGADDFDGALAIQHALEDGVQVANCSWGAGPLRAAVSREARACDTAWALGLTIVKSAGNRGPEPATLTTPADAEGVLVVGATDHGGTAVQEYSSRGPTPDGRARPHLVAPGGSTADSIVSCLVDGGSGPCGPGTSFAAPHVTGLLALLLEDDPDLSPDDQRARLLGMCRPLAGAAEGSQGAGLVDVRLGDVSRRRAPAGAAGRG